VRPGRPSPAMVQISPAEVRHAQSAAPAAAPTTIAGPNAIPLLTPTRPAARSTRAITALITNAARVPATTAGHPSQPRKAPSGPESLTSPSPRPEGLIHARAK